MAKKSSKSTKSSKPAQTSSVGRAAKKAYKANPKAFVISVVAIVLVVAIATAVVYFAFPDTWNDIVATIKGDGNGGDTGNIGGNDIEVDGSKVVGGNLTGTVARKDGELLFHMINVGQGDCLYLQLPDGSDMVIDGGSTKKPYDKFSKNTVIDYLNKYIKDNTIEYLMLTHTDDDHVGFLDDIIDEFEVRNIYMPYILASPDLSSLSAQVREEFMAIPQEKKEKFQDPDVVKTATYAEFFAAALNEEDCQIHFNMDDDENTNNILIRDEAQTYEFKFYCPTKEYYAGHGFGNADGKADGVALNAISPVGILSYKNRKIMFTGDSNEGNESEIVRRTSNIDCDVLKVAHHGSKGSSSKEFLSAYTFEYAMISCGTHKTYNHPNQQALDRMQDMEVYRTDKNGTIILSVDKSGNMSFMAETASTQKQNHIGNDAKTATKTSASAQNLACLFFVNKAA